jgi:hypothetical protein
MFAMKSMDKLLRLKLDMVYRNLSVEEAQKLHSELQAPPLAAAAESAEPPAPQPAAPPAAKPKTAIKGKVVKTIKTGKK